MAVPKAEIYSRKMRRLRRALDRESEEAVRASLRLLDETRARLSRQLTELGERGWAAFWLPRYTAMVDELIGEFRDRLSAEVAARQEATWLRGIRAAEEPLEAIGAPRFVLPDLSPRQLVIAQGYSADLIRGITDDARNRINTILRRAILAEEPRMKTFAEIREILSTRKKMLRGKRRRHDVAYKAELVTRTEVNRAYSLGHHGRQEQIAEKVPGIKKMWCAVLDHRTREGHALAHSHYHANPIPMRQKFRVGLREPMDFPHDPAGHASDICNCRCWVEQFHPNWDAAIERLAKEHAGVV